MKIMGFIKKYLFVFIISILGIVITGGYFNIPNEYKNSEFYYEYNNNGQDTLNTDIGEMIKSENLYDNNNSVPRLLKLFKLSEQDWYNQGTGKAIYYVKWIINMLLSITSFISLVLIIFSFFMIFFSKDDSGVKKAKDTLIGTFIALTIMGLSRFIVSIFFRIERGTTSNESLINSNTNNNIVRDNDAYEVIDNLPLN